MPTTKVRRGDKVYVLQRPCPQGIVEDINYYNEIIVVRYFDEAKPADRTQEMFDFDQFEDNWTDTYGGLWMLADA